MKLSIGLCLATCLLGIPAWAQTPDGAAKTEDREKPTPQETNKDPAEKESVEKAPDQTAPPKSTTPPTTSSDTKEAK